MSMRKMWPSTLRVNCLKAFVLGVRDGWRQPYEVNSSRNVDHLHHDDNGNVFDNQDRGINLGQVLRSPFNHERF